jgi:glycerol uptake facilitator-like aquaporin
VLLLMAVQVPAYAAAQVLGSTAASITLRLVFGTEHFFGTVPSGSDVQSLVLEFIITFYLMFVVSGVATDNRAVSTVCSTSTQGFVFSLHVHSRNFTMYRQINLIYFPVQCIVSQLRLI